MDALSIQVCSDLDYEGMVVDICSKEGRIATISCDMGIENAKIVLYGKEQDEPIWELEYFSFKKALNDALQKLKEANPIE
ncbi:MAG: hypothetical protein K940chlam7_01648 [Chlamydiae bacterium]|nr:hypothetical protein [Chlamydiota bacterium]